GNAGAGEGIGIGPAPELAVGDDIEPDLLLQRDHAADGVVLDSAQLVAAELALGVPGSRLQKPRRSHQAADMLGAKRRIGCWSHETSKRRNDANALAQFPAARACGRNRPACRIAFARNFPEAAGAEDRHRSCHASGCWQGRRPARPQAGRNMLSPNDQPAIVAEGASKLFLDGTVVAFHQLSLAVRRDEIMCVVGPSGCGKTTLLRCIAGLTDLSTGKLLVHGRP